MPPEFNSCAILPRLERVAAQSLCVRLPLKDNHSLAEHLNKFIDTVIMTIDNWRHLAIND